jgi:hypothetical protein
VHELAHVLAGVGRGHDAVFRRAHVDLARHVFGDEPATWLTQAYDAIDLPPGERTWPAPPVSSGTAPPVAL